MDILLNLFTFSKTYIAELKLIGIMELLAILVCFIVSILSLQQDSWIPAIGRKLIFILNIIVIIRKLSNSFARYEINKF